MSKGCKSDFRNLIFGYLISEIIIKSDAAGIGICLVSTRLVRHPTNRMPVSGIYKNAQISFHSGDFTRPRPAFVNISPRTFYTVKRMLLIISPSSFLSGHFTRHRLAFINKTSPRTFYSVKRMLFSSVRHHFSQDTLHGIASIS